MTNKIRLAAIARDAAARMESIDSMVLSYKTYEKKDFPKLMEDIPAGKLANFLASIAVSGGKANLVLNEIELIDSGVVLLCWQSPVGSTEKFLMGMRTVAYFEPLKAAVLNLTVIFEDHRGQRNLDPINKVIFF